jgi:hypothetical protein
VDAWDGGADLVTGFAQDLGGLTGVWHDGQWAWSYFEQDGRDNFSAYMGENLEGLSLLTGFYDPSKPEGEQWGVESVDEWWGNFAPVAYQVGQGIVPTDEWDDRPSYVITQGVINVGSIVGGVVLSATGLGAVVGVPLVLSRLQTGFRAINVLGSDSSSVPGNADGDLSGTPHTPDTGRLDGSGSSSGADGNAAPDADAMLPDQSTFDDVNSSLGRLHESNNALPETSDSEGSVGDVPQQTGADAPSGSQGDTDASNSSTSSDSADSAGGTDSADTPGSADTANARESTESAQSVERDRDRASDQDTAGDRDEVDTQATPAEVERMLREVDEYAAESAGDLDAQAQVYGSRPEAAVNGDRVPEMVGAHNGDGPSAASNSTAVNGTGGSGGGSIDTPSGGSGDLRVDSGSSGSGDLTAGHGRSSGTPGTGGGTGGTSSGPGGDLTGGGPTRGGSGNDRPPTVGDPVPIGGGDIRFPGEREKFGDGVTLDPNKEYVVEGRGTFITDDNGAIVHIETEPGTTRKGNPELVTPRENTTYKITHPVSGAEYTYKTDHLGRTVSVEGDLKPGFSVRGAEQTAIGYEGRDYIEAMNNDPGGSLTYDSVDWNGGHLISGSEMGGPGERLNVIPMLKDLNQLRGTDYTNNYRRLELLWDGLISGNDTKLKQCFSKVEPDSARDLVIQQWKDKIANGPQPPDINVRITTEHDPAMQPLKGPNGQMINPPPESVIVDWTLNGEVQPSIRYENLPPSTTR